MPLEDVITGDVDEAMPELIGDLGKANAQGRIGGFESRRPSLLHAITLRILGLGLAECGHEYLVLHTSNALLRDPLKGRVKL